MYLLEMISINCYQIQIPMFICFDAYEKKKDFLLVMKF